MLEPRSPSLHHTDRRAAVHAAKRADAQRRPHRPPHAAGASACIMRCMIMGALACAEQPLQCCCLCTSWHVHSCAALCGTMLPLRRTGAGWSPRCYAVACELSCMCTLACSNAARRCTRASQPPALPTSCAEAARTCRLWLPRVQIDYVEPAKKALRLLSRPAQGLVRRLLVADPRQRLTLLQVRLRACCAPMQGCVGAHIAYH